MPTGDTAPAPAIQGLVMERLALGYSLIALMVAAILGVVIYLRRNTREQTDRRQRLKDDLQYEERLRKNADETDKEAK
jgi:hypothetical protein